MTFRELPSIDTKRILDLWEEGKDTYDIALAIGRPESVVYNVLARLSGDTTEARSERARRPA